MKAKNKKTQLTQKHTTKRFNKIKIQQILCHDKIRPQYGHLSATDYLVGAFPNQ